MKSLTLAVAAFAATLAAVPAMAQPSDTGNMAYPSPGATPQGSYRGGRGVVQRVPGGNAGYQSNTYVRRPSAQTPTDVGNMAFPDPSFTPAGNLPPVPVGR